MAQEAVINSLFAENIKATGSIRVGERYDKDGKVVEDKEDEAGAWLGNSGVLKANKAILDNVDAEGGNFKDITVLGRVTPKKGLFCKQWSNMELDSLGGFIRGMLDLDFAENYEYGYACDLTLLLSNSDTTKCDYVLKTPCIWLYTQSSTPGVGFYQCSLYNNNGNLISEGDAFTITFSNDGHFSFRNYFSQLKDFNGNTITLNFNHRLSKFNIRY